MGAYPQVASAIAERTIAPTVETTNRARRSLAFHFMGFSSSFNLTFRAQQPLCYVTEFRRSGLRLQGFWGVAAAPSDGADSAAATRTRFLTSPQEMAAR